MSDARTTETGTSGSYYFPSLDGLRFVAFLLLFLQHLPRVGSPAWFVDLQEKGGNGVDIFFTLSAFLLGSLALEERRRVGRFDFGRFILRRMLRIFPLLYFYSALNFLVSAPVHDPHAFARLAGTLLLVDNFLCWIDGYSQIPAMSHLWTLSFEMQAYLFIPLLAFAGSGRRSMLIVIAAGVFALAARAVFIAVGVGHPVIWVTPFLRPDSLLAGLVLAWMFAKEARSRANEFTIGIAAVVASVGYFLTLPLPHHGPLAIIAYPIIAVVSGSAVWAALRVDPVRRGLGCRPLALLGRISYGLYVYHPLAILLAMKIAGYLEMDFRHLPGFAVTSSLALTFTIMISALSYWLLEKPFLNLKLHFETVGSRTV
jgi:peptidoglycan/LPS O-acetylase OafA/YrhL